jgi:hypothetical protein
LREQLTGTFKNEPMPKQFIWSQVLTHGNTSLTVHHMYLKPEEVRNSFQWGFMSDEEKAEVPEIAVEATAEMFWDFVIIASVNNMGDIEETIKGCIFDGRIPTSTAIFLELLTWQKAQFNCQFMSEEEKLLVRNHPLGSPEFCRSSLTSEIKTS